ncbi:hypothetical protein BKA82DRAFT_999062 [Pisolithus tinctorius]|uniref:Uncharacterized protein n=1 Tax=Pisolithus tinctorius Marx 270 TaxID=870435 RepID=A0A0C3PEV5_PISTI|nr:hypothetical protein BKA82DRAFT_999062 [Pisolithus tinctorius]KIO06404.1 hypothetical protein M404DRAFT_999062 [Pisolithus tinctorius Marx 270]
MTLMTRLCALYPQWHASATPVKIFAVSNALEWSLSWDHSAARDYIRSQMTTKALIQNERTAWFCNSYMIAEWAMQIAVPLIQRDPSNLFSS